VYLAKKYIQIALSLLLILVAYLFFAHWLIYHRLARAGLGATDNRHTYTFNEQATNSPLLIFATLGDSLTAGVGTQRYEQSYPYLLASKLAGTSTRLTHLNFSYPGARTRDIIDDRLARAVEARPRVATILLGTNDVHGNVSLKDFTKNYATIITQLKTVPGVKINAISIPNIGSDDLLWPPYSFYYRSKVAEFNQIIKNLSRHYQINYIDLTTPTARLATKNTSYYSTDSFHPSSLGYSYWAQIIYDHLDF
jgi:lysophospholipase L1-like esterase